MAIKSLNDIVIMKKKIKTAENELITSKYAELGYLISRLPDTEISEILGKDFLKKSVMACRELPKPRIKFEFTPKPEKNPAVKTPEIGGDSYADDDDILSAIKQPKSKV